MKISELITQLEWWKQEFGDFDVVIMDKITDEPLVLKELSMSFDPDRIHLEPALWADAERIQ